MLGVGRGGEREIVCAKGKEPRKGETSENQDNLIIKKQQNLPLPAVFYSFYLAIHTPMRREI